MTSKLSISVKLQFALLCGLAVPLANVQAAGESQSVTVTDKIKIPGADLKAGTYTFSVEDRLADRAIVRITSADSDKHYLLLTTPNPKLSVASADGISYFTSTSDKTQALHAWKCATCSAPLEFAYPKLEAVKITDDSTETVLAVDPTYDKLPSNLSADDMKVVTLWLLSPERITPENVGKGVKAAKWIAPAQEPAPQTVAAATPPPAVADAAPAAPVAASVPAAPAVSPAPATSAPAAAPVETASSASAPARANGRNRLPKTASNTGLFLFAGLACLGGALAFRIKRARSLA